MRCPLLFPQGKKARDVVNPPPPTTNKSPPPIHPRANAPYSNPLQKAWVRNGRAGLEPLVISPKRKCYYYPASLELSGVNQFLPDNIRVPIPRPLERPESSKSEDRSAQASERKAMLRLLPRKPRASRGKPAFRSIISGSPFLDH